jgi:hypothetical protein
MVFTDSLPAATSGAVLAPAPRRGPAAAAAPASLTDGVVRLGAALLQVFPFETRRAGELRSSPPRTVGHTAVVLTGDDRRLDWAGPAEAAALCAGAPEERRGDDAATGKVVFCNRLGETHVYQADPQKGTAALCACGNATGAAAAALAHCLGRTRLRHNVKLPEGRVEIDATANRAADGWRVEQAWGGIRLHAVPAAMGGRDAAVCTGTFNDYLLVRLRDRAEPDALGMEDVLAWWSEGQRYGAFANPLQSRLAAIAPDGARPWVRFFTCGRMHPGAPLTGLATLAVAAGRVPWLAALLRGGEVEHRRGIDALPAVRVTGRGAEIQFPAIHVVLRESLALAA